MKYLHQGAFSVIYIVMDNMIEALSFPLPERLENALHAGFIDEAARIIDSLVCEDIPEALRQRLLLEKMLMHRRAAYYTYSFSQAEEALAAAFKKYEKGMLSSFMTEGLLDWAYINGTVMFEKNLTDNAAKRCAVLREETEREDPDLRKRDDCIAIAEEKGQVSACVKAEIRLTVTDRSFIGKKAHVNLPFPRMIEGRQYDIVLDSCSPHLVSIDDETALMRTAAFEKTLEGDDEFFLTFSYRISDSIGSFPRDEFVAPGMQEYLAQELPHIAFTPYLRALAEEITSGQNTMRGRAEAIYDWITSHVLYSFVRPYATYDNISQWAAVNLKGDCGVQAMLFITLCRISGIPAAWESGWYVTDEGAWPHDWARINISGRWFPVDCSFGGGAFRQGCEKRRRHYFGSLDALRMIANGACCRTLTGKKALAADPTDNQKGEVEAGGITLTDGIECRMSVLSYELQS